eukprot:133275_1
MSTKTKKKKKKHQYHWGNCTEKMMRCKCKKNKYLCSPCHKMDTNRKELISVPEYETNTEKPCSWNGQSKGHSAHCRKYHNITKNFTKSFKATQRPVTVDIRIHTKWTDEEDKLLIKIYNENKHNSWDIITTQYNDKSIHNRTTGSMTGRLKNLKEWKPPANHKRIPWTEEETQSLIDLYYTHNCDMTIVTRKYNDKFTLNRTEYALEKKLKHLNVWDKNASPIGKWKDEWHNYIVEICKYGLADSTNKATQLMNIKFKDITFDEDQIRTHMFRKKLKLTKIKSPFVDGKSVIANDIRYLSFSNCHLSWERYSTEHMLYYFNKKETNFAQQDDPITFTKNAKRLDVRLDLSGSFVEEIKDNEPHINLENPEQLNPFVGMDGENKVDQLYDLLDECILFCEKKKKKKK